MCFVKLKLWLHLPPNLCGQKGFTPPKKLLFLTHWFAWQKKEILFFCKIWIFKPYNEMVKPLVWYYRKRCIGEQRTWASTTFREVIWCVIPEYAGDKLFCRSMRRNCQKKRQWNYERGKVLSKQKTIFDEFSIQQKVLRNYLKYFFCTDMKPTTKT